MRFFKKSKNLPVPINTTQSDAVVENENDKYGLMAKISVADVKQYLKDEYDRATQREETITILEQEMEKLREISIKYDALLIIQEKNKERLKKAEDNVVDLKVQLKNKSDENKALNMTNVDIKVNSEKKITELKTEIAEVKKQLSKCERENKKLLKKIESE